MKSKETFASTLLELGRKYDHRAVFDDFLTITLTCFAQNTATGKSYDEDLYMATIAKYTKEEIQTTFPKLFGLLINEMEAQTGHSLGNDVLGEFFEVNVANKHLSQFFTPWPICEFMASVLHDPETEKKEPLRILDPACGSGRMLLAGAKMHGRQHSFYGIDLDIRCVKMTAINLFLNGVFNAEVMCADALSPSDFRMSYRISYLPFGVFRISEPEKSPLWQMHTHAFTRKENGTASGLLLPSQTEGNEVYLKGSQMKLF